MSSQIPHWHAGTVRRGINQTRAVDLLLQKMKGDMSVGVKRFGGALLAVDVARDTENVCLCPLRV